MPNINLKKLKKTLSLSILKKSSNDGDENSASVAISTSGKCYFGAKVESDTNLLDISSEQSALALAVAHRDYAIEEITTLTENESANISPLTLKVLSDFGVRTGKSVRYIVQNGAGKVLFKTTNPQKEIPFYTPKKEQLTLERKRLAHNFKLVDKNLKGKALLDELKKSALAGLESAFTTKDGSSRYGVAVMTRGGRIYFTGQYSSPEKRLGLHAEVATTLSALTNGDRDITHLALVSDKFTDSPATVCGCCRQWLSELSTKLGWRLQIICFAKNTSTYTIDSIETLLPNAWSSKTK